LSQPVITSVIAGATTPEQVASNVKAAADWRFSAAEMDEIKSLL
jgi:aryl-alcohol dehydrogenase-like predicted oxidoreductase